MTLTPNNSPVGFYNGMRVIVAAPPPAKIQLSPNVTVSAAYRENFNTWLVARFGFQPPLLPDGEFLVNKAERYMIGNAATVARLMATIKEQS